MIFENVACDIMEKEKDNENFWADGSFAETMSSEEWEKKSGLST